MSSLQVTLIQPDTHWENKNANLDMLGKLIASAPEKPGLIILPEMFSTGFSMNPAPFAETMDGPTMQWMRAMAAEKKSVLTGSIIALEDGRYYNRLIWMLPNGSYGFYDKRHLFAFAGEHLRYSAGNKRLIGSLNGWRINLLVCYDLRFPVWIRQASTASSGNEYDLIVFVANWPEKRNHAWKALLQARAIENQCYVIGVNRSGSDGNGISYAGESQVIDPLGNVLHSMAPPENCYSHLLDEKTLKEIRAGFPFWKDADHFNIEP